jgi:hypothetical protein
MVAMHLFFSSEGNNQHPSFIGTAIYRHSRLRARRERNKEKRKKGAIARQLYPLLPIELVANRLSEVSIDTGSKDKSLPWMERDPSRSRDEHRLRIAILAISFTLPHYPTPWSYHSIGTKSIAVLPMSYT